VAPCCHWPPVTLAPTWSSRECQTSGGLGPALASRGLGLARGAGVTHRRASGFHPAASLRVPRVHLVGGGIRGWGQLATLSSAPNPDTCRIPTHQTPVLATQANSCSPGQRPRSSCCSLYLLCSASRWNRCDELRLQLARTLGFCVLSAK
jgi:hypothetical protein